MDEEKVRVYADVAAQMMELHASIALLTQNLEKIARTDKEVTSMTRIFNGVFQNAAQQTNYRKSSPSK
ncbi:uncharacterized protein PHALS_10206 [Plasmopara halstedii]|uniref:DASH complex subunit DAD4 n=1 Tax=Plasmopara halstedii TaxID=4781 RepID=A0A0P1AGD7_PLAHL|nr:uncharacterized protein PHALS_10206 [Plasmopara halstedii]CEG39982.1 hypothetical protein PHALS_10206 [Plasmopara halstedii]|eukprot:XP_024576351.1 hypothetical protein PHALS_10206 [Plasmopara halstedii]